MYLRSSEASFASGMVAEITRLPSPGIVLIEPLWGGTDNVGGTFPATSLLTRSWIPTNWALASNTTPENDMTTTFWVFYLQLRVRNMSIEKLIQLSICGRSLKSNNSKRLIPELKILK